MKARATAIKDKIQTQISSENFFMVKLELGNRSGQVGFVFVFVFVSNLILNLNLTHLLNGLTYLTRLI